MRNNNIERIVDDRSEADDEGGTVIVSLSDEEVNMMEARLKINSEIADIHYHHRPSSARLYKVVGEFEFWYSWRAKEAEK